MKKRLIFISALLTIVPLTLVGMEKQPLEETKAFLDEIKKLKTFPDPKEWLNREIEKTQNNVNSLKRKLAMFTLTDDLIDTTEDAKNLEKANVQLDFLKSLQNHFNKNFPEINNKNDNPNEETKKN